MTGMFIKSQDRKDMLLTIFLDEDGFRYAIFETPENLICKLERTQEFSFFLQATGCLGQLLSLISPLVNPGT